MKESVYIAGKKKDYGESVSTKKPMFIILTVATILILLLNLINAIFF